MRIAGFLVLWIFLLLPFTEVSVFADWNEEKRKIDFLIASVEKSDAIFIRNGNEYKPADAASHLKLKLESAQSSWFAPSQEKWTIEMFIEIIASESSMTGNPYKIKFSDGKIILAKDWLFSQLTNMTKRKL